MVPLGASFEGTAPSQVAPAVVNTGRTPSQPRVRWGTNAGFMNSYAEASMNTYSYISTWSNGCVKRR